MFSPSTSVGVNSISRYFFIYLIYRLRLKLGSFGALRLATLGYFSVAILT